MTVLGAIPAALRVVAATGLAGLAVLMPGPAVESVYEPAATTAAPVSTAPFTTTAPSASDARAGATDQAAGTGTTVPAAATGTTADDPGPGAPGPAPGVQQRQECAPQAPAAPASGGGDPLASVHRLADGTGVRIAVIDTGVAPHPRLAGRLTGGGDYVEGGDGLSDCDGHGTEVAGLLAAAPDPATRSGGGIAPAAQIVSLRQSSARFTVTGPDGRDRPAGEIDTLAAAIERAVTLGATVVNISEVVCVPADRADEAGAPLQRAVRRATAAGVVVVAAAGNVDATGTCTGDPSLRPMPALFDDVIAVGAVDGTDRPAPFSVPGAWVDVAAPGVDVRPSATGGGSALLSGTSYAAPVVSGVAALMQERFPSLTPDQIADRIRATARHPARGHDERVGHGVVDPEAALTAEPLLLRPPTDRADVVDGPGDGAALLPGLGTPPSDHTPAVLGGLLTVLVLGAATTGALRRLRAAPRPPAPPEPPAPDRGAGPRPRTGRDGPDGQRPARPPGTRPTTARSPVAAVPPPRPPLHPSRPEHGARPATGPAQTPSNAESAARR